METLQTAFAGLTEASILAIDFVALLVVGIFAIARMVFQTPRSGDRLISR